MTTTRVRISAWAYMKGVSSLTSLHCLWRWLGQFSQHVHKGVVKQQSSSSSSSSILVKHEPFALNLQLSIIYTPVLLILTYILHLYVYSKANMLAVVMRACKIDYFRMMVCLVDFLPAHKTIQPWYSW